jgi:hypothetical protein
MEIYESKCYEIKSFLMNVRNIVQVGVVIMKAVFGSHQQNKLYVLRRIPIDSGAHSRS